MSVPLSVMAARGTPYHHGNYCHNILRDIQGAMEMMRLGVEKFYENFPNDQENKKYLAKLTRPFYLLENEIDMWEEMFAGLSQAEARNKLEKLRARVFYLSTKMGPAAEAYAASIDPATPQPEKVKPWRTVSADQLRRPLQLWKEAMEEVDYHRYKEEIYLNQLEETSQELALVKSLSEQAAAAKTEPQDLQIETLCLQFKNLKV